MDAYICIHGDDAEKQILSSLESTLRRAKDVSAVQYVTDPPKDDEMGLDWELALQIALNSAAIVVVAKSIHVWLRDVVRRNVKVTIEAEGKSLTLDATNPQDEQEILKKAAEVFGNANANGDSE